MSGLQSLDVALFVEVLLRHAEVAEEADDAKAAKGPHQAQGAHHSEAIGSIGRAGDGLCPPVHHGFHHRQGDDGEVENVPGCSSQPAAAASTSRTNLDLACAFLAQDQ